MCFVTERNLQKQDSLDHCKKNLHFHFQAILHEHNKLLFSYGYVYCKFCIDRERD